MIYVGNIAINPEHVISVYPVAYSPEAGNSFRIVCRDHSEVFVGEANCGIVRGENEPKEGPDRRKLKEERRLVVTKVHDEFVDTLINIRMLR